MIKTTIVAMGVTLALLSGAALAQTQEGLVNVIVDDVSLLDDAQVQVPVTVQVPVGVAANVCGIDANIIAEQRKGDENWSCTAKNKSQALNQFVAKQKQQ